MIGVSGTGGVWGAGGVIGVSGTGGEGGVNGVSGGAGAVTACWQWGHATAWPAMSVVIWNMPLQNGQETDNASGGPRAGPGPGNENSLEGPEAGELGGDREGGAEAGGWIGDSGIATTP